MSVPSPCLGAYESRIQAAFSPSAAGPTEPRDGISRLASHHLPLTCQEGFPSFLQAPVKYLDGKLAAKEKGCYTAAREAEGKSFVSRSVVQPREAMES